MKKKDVIDFPAVLASLDKDGRFVCHDPVRIKRTRAASACFELLRYGMAEIVEEADGRTTIKPTELYHEWRAERVARKTKAGPCKWRRIKITQDKKLKETIP